MRLTTNKLLLVSVIIFAIVILLATFWVHLGLTQDQTVFLPMIGLFAFGINIAGLIIGWYERKKAKWPLIIGIAGHSVLIIIFISFTVYAAISM